MCNDIKNVILLSIQLLPYYLIEVNESSVHLVDRKKNIIDINLEWVASRIFERGFIGRSIFYRDYVTSVLDTPVRKKGSCSLNAYFGSWFRV